MQLRFAHRTFCMAWFLSGVVHGQEIHWMHIMFRNSRPFAQPTRVMKSALLAALLVVLGAACPSFNLAFAQSATTGAISGVVSDTNGALLPGTTITVKSVATGATRTVKANSAGEYRVTELEPGTYTAVFTSDGFETYQESAITVTVGGLSNVSPKLKVGSVSDKVEVTDETPMLHTEDSSISTTIDQNAIDNLPINGRRWSNFALLTPGVVSNSDGFGLLSFRGISFLLNNSTVDGADNNQAYFSEERGPHARLLLHLAGCGAGVPGQSSRTTPPSMDAPPAASSTPSPRAAATSSTASSSSTIATTTSARRIPTPC